MPPSSDSFITAGGTFVLRRFPLRKNELLRAWNSADQLLVDYALGDNITDSVLVVNDEYGAVSLAVNSFKTTLWTDSSISWSALKHNFLSNNIPVLPELLWSTEKLTNKFKLVLIRLPKQLALLDHQLKELKPYLQADALVLTAGMDKHTSEGVLEILNKIIGPTERHRGVKKAHIFSTRNDCADGGLTPYPSSYFCEEVEGELINHANTFSREQLDIGSRFMIKQFSRLPQSVNIVDLACGNGVLGIAAAKRVNPSRLVFLDESNMSVVSALLNANALLTDSEINIEAYKGDGFEHYSGVEPDLILCNPPFHQNFVVDGYVGQRLVRQAAGVLGKGGTLWLVANRHLPYFREMKSLFSSVKKIAENSKFLVLEGKK